MSPFLLIAALHAPQTERRPHDDGCIGAVFWVSSVVVGGSALVDIVSAPASARRYNRSAGEAVPVPDASPDRRDAAHAPSYWREEAAPPYRARPQALPQPQPAPTKSPGTGLLLSVLGTGVPLLLSAMDEQNKDLWVASGLVVGPSVGHFYAHRVWRGLATIGLRATASTAWIWSVVSCIS